VTVIDSSGVVDYLLGAGTAASVARLFGADGELAAPDVVVFEVLAALRRLTRAGMLDSVRAQGALEDLGELQLSLFPSAPLRFRAWDLRENLTAADGLFVALAEKLKEPFATADRRLSGALDARGDLDVEVIALQSR
jgi:predicted nucleic acid-binding protein